MPFPLSDTLIVRMLSSNVPLTLIGVPGSEYLKALFNKLTRIRNNLS